MSLDVPARSLVGPARATGYGNRIALGVMLAGIFVTVMDNSIVNVAIPSIRTTLGATFGEAELVVAGYTFTFAIGLITGGRLGDVLGQRRMFLAGFVAFTLTSALCGLAPDPRTLGAGFSWKSALLTMIAAGARPCSGAILVLVFALAQGIFSAGIFAVGAMSLGTAITTASLASAAVFAKNAAVKYSKSSSQQALIAGRLFEFGAAVAVLGLGLALLLAVLSGGSVAN